MSALEANQPIQLVLGGHTVTSRVIRCVRQEVYVDALRDSELELTPLPGRILALRWTDDDTLWEQQGQVMDVLDPIPIIVFKMHGSPKVVEKRSALRVKMAIPIEYGLLRPDSEMLVTTTTDVSSAGLRFPCAVKVWLGLQLRLLVKLDQQRVALVCRVVRVSPRPREIRGRQSWDTAVQFIHMSPRDRRIVDNFVRTHHSRLKAGRSERG